MFITNLISKITNFRVKIGDKLNTLKSQIGQLNLLTTNDKTSLVGAVNEVNNIQEDLVPLAGTKVGKPLTGTLKVDESIDRLLQVGEYEVEPSPENPIGMGKIGYVTMKEDFFSYLGTYRPDHNNIKVSQFLVGQHPTLNVPVIGTSYMDISTGFTMGYTLIPDELGRASFMIQADYITVNNDFTTVEPGNKSILAQRSYVDKAIGNFKLPTNWESPQQRFSGLEDKSSDATYNKVMVLDDGGKAGTKDVDDLDYVPLSGTKEGKPIEGVFTANDYEIVSNGEANGKPTSLEQFVNNSSYSVVAFQGEEYDLVSSFALDLDEGFVFAHLDNINNKYAYQYINKDYYKLWAGGIAFETQDGKAKLTDFNTKEPFIATEDDDIVTKKYLDSKLDKLVLTSPSDNKFELSVDDNGNLITTKIN